MKTSWIIAVLFFSGIIMEATAQVHSNARKRYVWRQGAFNNGITPRESARLNLQKREIRQDLRQAKRNDGRIGPLEKRHIRSEVKQYKRQRFLAKHNRRRHF